MGNLLKVSEFKSSVVKTLDSHSNVDLRIVISEKNWLESSAIDQMKKTAELPGMCCGIGMPDLHPGKGQPIGAAFITRDVIYPHLVGSDIGCGMGLWKLDVKKRQVKLDKWEKKLVGLDDSWQGGDIDQWLSGFGLDDTDAYFKESNVKLGTIGGGNHFAEIQNVHEIYDHDELLNLGLDQQSVVFLAHSGSRGLGQKILRDHVDRFSDQGLLSSSTTDGAKDESEMDDANQYLRVHDYAVQWGIANRSLIAERFSQCLNVSKSNLLDVAHNKVTALDNASAEALGLKISDGTRYWIHRKGVSPTNQGVVMIPGSRGSLSYLVKPRVLDVKSQAIGGFSLAHGAGRKWKRSESKGKLGNQYKAKDLEVTSLGSRVICKQKGLLFEEAPQAYKNISTVVDDLVQAGMIDVVASFKPLITYKTRKV